MAKLIIASHGSLAGGIVSAMELLFGKKNNLVCINGYLDDKNPEDELVRALEEVDGGQVILFSDLPGSSIHQMMLRQLVRENVEMVAGYNLAVVLEFLIMDQEVYSEKDIRRIVSDAREQLVYVERTAMLPEEDFFNEEAEV